MRQKRIVSTVLAGFLLPCVQMTAFANSSWHWFTDNPLTILPWAVLATLIAETFMICYFGKIQNILFPFAVIVLANLLSFLTPYLFLGIPEANMPYEGFAASVNHTVSKFPVYIVNLGFLVLTLVVEVPVVYNLLRKKAENKKRLLGSVIAANTVTTAAVAIIERLFCRGSW